jgi:hypothetical protein
VQSNAARAAVAVVLAAVAVVLFIVLSDVDEGSNDAPPAPAATTGSPAGPTPPPIETIRVRGGEPVGGVRVLSVEAGDAVRFRVSSDLPGEVHVHGYDDEKEIEAGASVGFDFEATLEGGFEIELHHGGGETQIGELRVQPG